MGDTLALHRRVTLVITQIKLSSQQQTQRHGHKQTDHTIHAAINLSITFKKSLKFTLGNTSLICL